MIKYVYFFILLCIANIECRSPFRKQDPLMPVLSATYKKNQEVQYKYSGWFYYKEPIFTVFNKEEANFFSNMVVQEHSITDRFANKIVLTYELLDHMLETVVAEVKSGKRNYSYFTVLQDKNFNRKKKCGLIVLKFKEHPFVAKLFIEHPTTLLNPFCKGFENRVFHFMGHGVNRHISGLTRIPNLKQLQKTLQDQKQYHVIVPRKWLWLPHDPEWIEITGHNIVQNEIITSTIPGIYIIIADELKPNPEYGPMAQSESNKVIMQFCNDVGLTIDPNSANFIIQKDPNDEIIISIVDTEHFPTLVGFSETMTFLDHTQWYFSLAWKALSDLFMTSKQDHISATKA